MAGPGLEVAAARAENPAMRARWWPSLAILLIAVGPAAADEVTVYRCQDDKGRVSLQDEPCSAGQSESTRNMVRPRDPPPRPAPAEPAPETSAEPASPPIAEWSFHPPPPLFQCTDYDGEVRYSEDYDPNTRCVPLSVLGYDLRGAPQAATSCRWVQESCLQLDDASACEQFEAKLKQARSDALHAFSDTAAYRKSEVQRLERIVNDSCR
jgi:hypothetical protein